MSKGDKDKNLLREPLFDVVSMNDKTRVDSLHLRFAMESGSVRVDLTDEEKQLIEMINDFLGSPIVKRVFGKLIDPDLFRNILQKYAKAGAIVGSEAERKRKEAA